MTTCLQSAEVNTIITGDSNSQGSHLWSDVVYASDSGRVNEAILIDVRIFGTGTVF